ncbi:LOW QUALITY PROTEIN: histone deacetylase 6-like [Pomacea canaliculata]|uniref:LOW QUALITY PROTEIN: histone deacetylase 6-like n=1 Tax=Pomacea canaliculata TaxID=400727 RepID=UPI000D7355EA|nr:LOW QUALITY PROTEIN: histone deacetylase 6-like [Pomacea canaliculata]
MCVKICNLLVVNKHSRMLLRSKTRTFAVDSEQKSVDHRTQTATRRTRATGRRRLTRKKVTKGHGEHNGGQEQKDVDGGIPEFHQAAHETDGTNSDTEAELLRNMASMKVSEEGPSQFLGTGFIYDELMTKHKCEWDENYQECPERLLQPFARCEELGLVERCVRIPITYATEDQILWQHSSSALEIMKTTPTMTPKEREDLAKNYDAWFSSSATFECSMAAAGSSIDLVDHILKKKVTNGFAMIRPPGHHAMHDEYCGYCTFNNVAIAATHALNSGIERILIVDWDVHHGQATQYMFYDDPRVIYFSIHRSEYGTFWPYLRECDYDFIGEGPGKGYNINVPLNKIEMGDADYVAIFQNLLLPIAYEFSPQLVIISSGYDAAIGCPEGHMLVTPAAYAHFIHMLSALCEGRVCTVLEGGYCIQSLAEGCALTVRSLLGDPCPLLPPLGEPSDSIITTILNVIKVLRPYWKCLQASQLLGPGELCPFEEVNSNPPREGVKFYTPETRPKEYPITGFYHVQTPEVFEGFKQKINHLIRETSLAKAPHKVCFIFDADMRKHSNTVDSTHPEQPNRISSIFDKHNEWGLLKRCLQLESRLATDEEILAVHSKEYLEDIVATESMEDEELSSRPLDKNYNSIYISQDTSKCARLAVGSALQVVECVLSGQAQSGVAVVRPPGHHAEHDKAMGFCFFNNVAIAAVYAKKKFGLNRILIVDWDVHHGNGTQNSFYDDRSVLYLSLHRYENARYFPDKEDADYLFVGGKNAEGYNVNIPWSQERMGNGDYMAAFQRIVMPIAYQFAPELILVSAGFDAAHGDPLGGYHVMPECYGQMTHMLKGLANGRIILVLEGGYNLEATAESMATCTSVLLGDPCPPLEFEEPSSSALKTIQQVVETHKKILDSLEGSSEDSGRAAIFCPLRRQLPARKCRHLQPRNATFSETKTLLL